MERARTNASGLTVELCRDTPFGMNLICTSPTDQSPIHFASLQYDPEAGKKSVTSDEGHVASRGPSERRGFGVWGCSPLATAHSLLPLNGRWMSPDPAGLKVVHLDDPQTWNMYAYVRNNPTTLTDPTGLEGSKDPSTCDPTNGTACGGNVEASRAHASTPTIAVALAPAVETLAPTTAEAIGGIASLPLYAPAALVGASLGLLITNVSNALIDNYNGEEQLSAIESVVAVENSQKLSMASSGSGGVTSSGQKTDQYGNKLGPSGEPQINEVDHATRKGAQDAARAEGRGRPVQHPSPREGKPHFHGADGNGEKIPNSTHHNYPD